MVLGTFSVDLLSDMEFLVYRLPKTGRGMSDHESVRHTDLIVGSYLWAGSPADVFVTQQTTQHMRRDKAKTREYRRRITIEWLAAAQARLQDLDLVAQKRKEHTLNPVGRGRGMTTEQINILPSNTGGNQSGSLVRHPLCPFSRIGQPCRMTITWRESLLNSSMILRRPTQRTQKTALKRMMMTPLWVPTRLISRVVMIRTEPVEPIPLTGIKGATSGNTKRAGVSIPPMLRRKRTGVRVRWSCLCSRTPLKRAH